MLPFVALVPLAVWLRGLPASRAGAGSAARGGALFGAVHFGLVLYWIPIALGWLTRFSIAVYLLVLLGMAALTAAFAWLAHRALHAHAAPLWLALPVTWTALEWTLAHLPSTLAYPWLGLGTTLTGFPTLVGVAELVGARGVGFWIAGVNALVATLLVSGAAAWAGRGVVLALVAVVLAPTGWGVWRARTLEVRPLARVAVVQPAVGPELKLDPAVALDSTLAALERLVPRMAPGTVDLVALPEVVVPVHPELPGSAATLSRLQAHAREVGAPLLFGALGVAEAGPPPIPHNSVFLMQPQGIGDFRYDKHHLVPVVERVPFLPSRIFGADRDFGAYAAGDGWPLARADEAAFGVLVCFESAFAEMSRAYRLAGADALVNVTNDAWYGATSGHARTAAFWQHPAHLVMRAIETRTGIARSANSGISLFVDPIGRISNASALDAEDVRIGEVLTTDVVTAYVRWGDLIGSACTLVAFGLLLLAVVRPTQGAMGAPGGAGHLPGRAPDV